MTPSGRHESDIRQTVVYGKPAGEALREAFDAAPASRVVLVTNTSLASPADEEGPMQRVKAALGTACVDVVTGMRAHSPREDVVRLAARLRDADAVVALGGGSVCDAVKAARLCLANGVTEAADMDRLRGLHAAAGLRPPTLRSIAIPTTLSAGEFTPNAGVTDERGPRKESYRHPRMPPDVVILDPSMALGTPARLWFSTGMRAVDHAVESWCGIDATPYSDAMSLHALRLLVPALRRCASDRSDLEAILQCQLGAWLSIQGFASGVHLGASHGIGHALGGTAGMPHGETSCVMLPHVLRFNAAVDEGRQRELSIAMERPGMAAGDVVAELVASLGLPGRLRDAGVPRELLDTVAQEGIRDAWVRTNPRPIDGAAGVRALLEAAW